MLFLGSKKQVASALALGILMTSSAMATSNVVGDQGVQVGPRPYYLVNDMDESALKEELKSCENGPFYKTDFSIGHRGAAMHFPEHTKESYVAAARMGAGILECDVTFTKDEELVCRHSQCDLHTTTDILTTELAEKCSEGFTPAIYDDNGEMVSPASAKCCTSDITLEEFRTLKGKMDGANNKATTVEGYMDGTAGWRTDLYSQTGTLMTHKESIELFKSLGAKFTPELKSPSVVMPYNGTFSQHDYAQKMIDEYIEAGVPAKDVWAQSFNMEDVQYWVYNTPEFGQQAVYLDGRYSMDVFNPQNPASWTPSMDTISGKGIKYIAPPMWVLLAVDSDGNLVPSEYAKAAKEAGFKIITWTLERSGLLGNGGGWYYQTVAEVINNDGDMMNVMDVLAQDVGIVGLFSDWPGTVTYYANCKGL